MSSYLSLQFKYMIFHIFTCKKSVSLILKEGSELEELWFECLRLFSMDSLMPVHVKKFVVFFVKHYIKWINIIVFKEQITYKNYIGADITFVINWSSIDFDIFIIPNYIMPVMIFPKVLLKFSPPF